MTFIAIAACDPKGIIGKNGALPWHYPEDLAHFRRTTLNNVMIMGYKTFLSMPPQAFMHRQSIVFSRTRTAAEHVTIRNLDELFRELSSKKHFVIGGSEIYELFFSQGLITEAIITHIHKEYEGDTYFPLQYLREMPREIIHRTPEFFIAGYTSSKPCPFR